MARFTQSKATRGSQRWLQELVNDHPDLLTDPLRPQLGLGQKESITWLSPLASDEFAEYRDQAFLDQLDINLKRRALKEFWPSNGPQWDALGKTSRGDILLVEAKAHLSEPKSNCGAGAYSLATIQKSLDETGKHFGATSTAQWTQTYYQYANRLAHLYLLRQLNGLPAWLIFLNFVNADDVNGPRSVEEWEAGIRDIHAHLGIKHERLAPHVIDLFLDVSVGCRPKSTMSA